MSYDCETDSLAGNFKKKSVLRRKKNPLTILKIHKLVINKNICAQSISETPEKVQKSDLSFIYGSRFSESVRL